MSYKTLFTILIVFFPATGPLSASASVLQSHSSTFGHGESRDDLLSFVAEVTIAAIVVAVSATVHVVEGHHHHHHPEASTAENG